MIFKISETTLKEKKRTFLTIGMVLPFIVVLLYFIFQGQSKLDPIVEAGFALGLLIAELILLIIGFRALRKLKKQEVHLDEKSLKRVLGAHEEVINWEDVRKVQVQFDREEAPRQIRLKTADHKIQILGMEKMEELLGIIKERIPENVKVKSALVHLNLNHPILLLIAALAGGILIPILLGYGQALIEAFTALVFICVGAYFFILRPLYRNFGNRFKSVELILGAAMILLGLGKIIYTFFPFILPLK